jgi:xylulokinase
VTSPVRMWTEAFDLAFEHFQLAMGDKMSHIVAVSSSAQQHGSVYWDLEARTTLSSQVSSSMPSLPSAHTTHPFELRNLDTQRLRKSDETCRTARWLL